MSLAVVAERTEEIIFFSRDFIAGEHDLETRMNKKTLAALLVAIGMSAYADAQVRFPRLDSVVCDLRVMVQKLDNLNHSISSLESRMNELNAGIMLTNQKMDTLIAGIQSTNGGIGSMAGGLQSLEATMKSMDEKMATMARLAAIVEKDLVPYDDEDEDE